MISTSSALSPPSALEQLLWCSYVLHTCSEEELQSQLQQLTLEQQGHLVPLLRRLLHSSQGLRQQLALAAPPIAAPNAGAFPSPLLSAREQEILALVARGYTLPQIGEKLFISPTTVNNHCARMREKLGLRGRNALITFAADQNRYIGDF